MTKILVATRRPPVDTIRVTPRGGYGFDRGDVRHYAWDLGGKVGTPVYAPEDLEVVQWAAGDDDAASKRLTGYGPAVVLAKGASGVWHVLAHLDGWAWSGAKKDRLPWIGRKYKAGELVGEISKLNHVHWEIRLAPWPPTGDARQPFTMDPARWLAGDPIPPAPPGGGGGGGKKSPIGGAAVALLILGMMLLG